MRFPEVGDPRVRTIQIICAALIGGVVTFVAIAFVVVSSRGGGEERPEAMPVITFIAIAFLLPSVASSMVVPGLLTKQQVDQIGGARKGTTESQVPPSAGDEDKLLAVYQTRTIVANAILEGAAFFGGVAFLIEGRLYALAVPGVAVLLMLMTFPTRGRIEEWIGDQMVRIRDARM